MTADKPSHPVPQLRFPEFRDTSGWSKRALGEFLTPIVRAREKPAVPYTGLGIRSHGKGTFRKEHEHPEKTVMDRLYEVDCNDLIVNITFAWEGAIAIVRSEDAGALVSHRFPTYQYDQNTLLTDFFRYPILDKQFIYKLGVISPGGAGRNRVLNKADFLKIELAIPEVTEQQKIADCLGSLDDLVAAEGRKLEALRQHKQGLMQQLFPQPGETQPLLRFTEFRDAPDWGQVALGTLLDRPPEYGANAAAVPFSVDLPAYIRITDIDDDGRFVPAPRVSIDIEPSDDQYLQPGDIVLARTGASVGKSYLYREEVGRLVFAGFLIRVRPNLDQLVPEFLSAYLSTWSYWDWVRHTSVRSGQPGINGSEYASMPLTIPPDAASLPEQRKIADCLGSLDDLIAAEGQKLEALKTHKQGLMQQVFPLAEGTLSCEPHPRRSVGTKI